MTQKEKRQEEKELEQAVKTLRATLRSIAHRKARAMRRSFFFVSVI